MAHELEIIEGKAQMAYAGDVPWHGLGTKVRPDLTPAQMMEAAGLNWSVEKHPQFIEIDGERIFTGQNALVRSTDNRVLTHVGDGWNPVQNEEAFEFFHEFVLAGDMEMHTAGSLKNGQVVWALAKTTESFDVFGGDQVDSYLLFSNPHRYGQAIDVRFTPIRVVCNNTLTWSLQQATSNGWKAGHHQKFNAQTVKETLGLAHEKFAKYKEMAEFLGSKRVTGEDLVQYFNGVFPHANGAREAKQVQELSKIAKMAADAFEKQPGAQYAEGSYWQALNAVTYVTDHMQGRSADSRLYSSWFGTNLNRKQRAAELAVKMAEAA